MKRLNFLFIPLAIINLASFATCRRVGPIGVSKKTTIKLHSQKRSISQGIVTCLGESCKNGVCFPEFYEGPDPPKWCQREASFSQSKCDWSSSFIGHWSNCDQTSYGIFSGFKKFGFNCNGEQCMIETCKDDSCETTPMSKTQFEQEFLNKLPNCKDVDTRKRQAGGTNAFTEYCCDVMQRWENGISGVVRPKRG